MAKSSPENDRKPSQLTDDDEHHDSTPSSKEDENSGQEDHLASTGEVDTPSAEESVADVRERITVETKGDGDEEVKSPEAIRATAGSATTNDNEDEGSEIRAARASDPRDENSSIGEPGRGRGFKVSVLAGVIVVLVIAAAAIWAGLNWNKGRTVETARTEAVTVAREEAVNLTSIDFHHADQDVQNVLANATGEFAGLFKQNMDSYVKIVKDGQVVTKGNVIDAGVESSDDKSARVLLAVQSKVQNKQIPAGEARGYRMVASVDKQADGQWRVGRVEFLP